MCRLHNYGTNMSKLLLQLSAGDFETYVAYALVELSDEMKRYLHLRKLLFNGVSGALSEASSEDDNDMNGIMFDGFKFITFYENLDIDAIIGTSPNDREKFDELGYWEVPDVFDDNSEINDGFKPLELDQQVIDPLLVLDGETWCVFVTDQYGVETSTWDIPYHILGAPFESLEEVVERSR